MEQDELKNLEESKREKCWDPIQKWQVLQETIAWVDSQQVIPRNSCLGALNAQKCMLISPSKDNL